jgi:hypothetical protein
VINLTNKSDEILLQNHRCPHCGAGVVSSWNLETTGLVYCEKKCKEGKYLFKPSMCEIIEDVVDGEFLEDIEIGEVE